MRSQRFSKRREVIGAQFASGYRLKNVIFFPGTSLTTDCRSQQSSCRPASPHQEIAGPDAIVRGGCPSGCTGCDVVKDFIWTGPFDDWKAAKGDKAVQKQKLGYEERVIQYLENVEIS